MAEKDAEDVEHVMAIISKSERVNDGVVVDHHQHYCHCGTCHYLSWDSSREAEGPDSCWEDLTVDQRPGEEGKVRPDVDHLGKMDRRNMVLLVPLEM